MTIKQYQKLQEIINETLSQLEKEVIASGLSPLSKEYDELALTAKEKIIENMGFTPEEYRAASLSGDTLIDESISKNAIIRELQRQIESLQSSIEEKFANAESDTISSIEQVKYSLNEVELRIKGLINGSEGTSLTKIRELSQRLSEEISRIEDSIPEATNLSGIEARLQQLESSLSNIQDFSTITPEQLADKLNLLTERVKPDVIIGYRELERLVKANVNLPKDFDVRIGVSKTEMKRLTDRVVTLEAGGSTGGGHTIQDEGTPLTQRTNLNFVGAGVTVTDDSGNNATVVTISTSAGAGYQAVTSGSINGTNTVFTWAVAPNAIVVDGQSLRKVASDGTVNWTGTTTTTLTIAPNFDVYGVA